MEARRFGGWVLGDVLSQFEERLGRLGVLIEELSWLGDTQGKVGTLSDDQLATARTRVEATAAGKIPGAEKKAAEVLSQIKVEVEKRQNKGLWAAFEKVAKAAREAADKGKFDVAMVMVAQYTTSELKGIRDAATKAHDEFKQEKAATLSTGARKEFAAALVTAEKHASALRLEEAIETLASFEKSAVVEIRSKAQEKIRAYRKLNARLGKFAQGRKKVDELLKSGRWSDLSKADEFMRRLVAPDAPERVKELARRKLAEIAKERERLRKTFEKQGLAITSVEAQARLGSDALEDNNRPHTVALGTYLVSSHEVTNAEYGRFVKDTRRKPPVHWRRIRNITALARHPVTWVTAKDAQEYCRWLTKKRGKTFRLLTPDEWEAAAGWDAPLNKVRRYPWGEKFDAPAAHLDGNRSSEVGSHKKDQSPSGLWDMAGNVCEWTYDPKTRRFVVCGGGFEDGGDEAAARCAFRQSLPPRTRGGSLGFRVAGELD